jgi:hypothetical protein
MLTTATSAATARRGNAPRSRRADCLRAADLPQLLHGFSRHGLAGARRSGQVSPRGGIKPASAIHLRPPVDPTHPARTVMALRNLAEGSSHAPRRLSSPKLRQPQTPATLHQRLVAAAAAPECVGPRGCVRWRKAVPASRRQRPTGLSGGPSLSVRPSQGQPRWPAIRGWPEPFAENSRGGFPVLEGRPPLARNSPRPGARRSAGPRP